MLNEQTSTTSQTRQQKANKAGMWAAIVVTLIPILSACMTLGTLYGGMFYNQFGSRGLLLMMNFFDYGQSALSLLWALVFAVLMACLYSFAPAEKRKWLQVGLILALTYLLLLIFNYLISFAPNFRFTFLERIFPALESRFRPWAFGTLIYTLMGLAALFAIPAFTRGGLERAIRWCLGISGVLLIACGVVWIFSPGAQINAMLSLATFLIRITIFPLTTAMIAVAFWRMTKIQPAENVSLPTTG